MDGKLRRAAWMAAALTALTPAAARADVPPTIAWSGDVSGSVLSAEAPTPLSVTASDDQGIAFVRFLDDARVVCVDTTAPYTCAYVAQAADVGPDTLSAVAVDTAGQTATVTRPVTVARFHAAGLAVENAERDGGRESVRGRLRLPGAISHALGCSGTVKVRLTHAGRTLATRTVKLDAKCHFAATLPASRGTLKAGASFAGNRVLQPYAAPAGVSVR